MKSLKLDTSQIALRFAQAGQSYPEQAIVQRKIARHLSDLITQYGVGQYDKVFEIGCGSGNLTQLLIQKFNIKDLILNDLYEDVQQHFNFNVISNPQVNWLIGDIEQLEFPKNLNMIASSSALQWVNDLDAIFKQAFHHLTAHAELCFSSFGQHNLREIKSLTGQGLNYLSIEDLQAKLQNNGFEILHLSEQIEQLTFTHPKQILQHLKATGVTATASSFRWTKQSLMDFYQNYQQFSYVDEAGVHQYRLTYHPIYCIARRMS
ncbi:MAG: malonyl-ACP O-methyltransferase BioC [Pseudomonadota bacterium]|uniref:Malonyl-[acyl-carrier protein] O-methyltransferase n=1 Tax=Acinetobacter bereziniae TaxID=106648 RepID=A0A8I1DGF5_ACIBZ|nr:malonyl-ACP O-methyltransferase BioC [Acinetobacter bereziniae]MBJ9951304.1 malonyl-ACP O-methyltransferase BioC [Acinetobacter bereziniae]MEC8123997.1 malonyl-ACP O-methyltransferase BioC [Pseudomonadota bacterium]QQC85367.1 malonyl-ACP O-methyltransferase BioC [Acinetobacter bereziniae]UUN98524.1 malonyl-ACP O-methyltransferase BioC [Acinetobacter bereziniae]